MNGARIAIGPLFTEIGGWGRNKGFTMACASERQGPSPSDRLVGRAVGTVNARGRYMSRGSTERGPPIGNARGIHSFGIKGLAGILLNTPPHALKLLSGQRTNRPFEPEFLCFHTRQRVDCGVQFAGHERGG